MRGQIKRLWKGLAAVALGACMTTMGSCSFVIHKPAGGTGQEVTESEWKAALDAVTTVTDAGIEMFGQTNYKMEVRESGLSVNLSYSVVSAGQNSRVSAEGTVFWDGETYLHVNDDQTITSYVYDEETESWQTQTVVFEDSIYWMFFLSNFPLEEGVDVILLSEILSYGSFTFNAETGVYEGLIDETIKRTFPSLSSDMEEEEMEVTYHFSGEASIAFSEGKIISMEYSIDCTFDGTDSILDYESMFASVEFTAGGQTVGLPDTNSTPGGSTEDGENEDEKDPVPADAVVTETEWRDMLQTENFDNFSATLRITQGALSTGASEEETPVERNAANSSTNDSQMEVSFDVDGDNILMRIKTISGQTEYTQDAYIKVTGEPDASGKTDCLVYLNGTWQQQKISSKVGLDAITSAWGYDQFEYDQAEACYVNTVELPLNFSVFSADDNGDGDLLLEAGDLKISFEKGERVSVSFEGIDENGSRFAGTLIIEAYGKTEVSMPA